MVIRVYMDCRVACAPRNDGQRGNRDDERSLTSVLGPETDGQNRRHPAIQIARQHFGFVDRF